MDRLLSADVPADIVADFRERVIAAGQNRTPDSLMEVVGPVVERLKSAGRPSEEALLALRHLSRESGLATAQYTFGIHQGSTYRMVDGVIGICIERTYALDNRAGVDGALS